MLYLAQRMARQALLSQADPAQTRPDCMPCSLNPVTGLLRWSLRCARSLGAVGAAAGFCSELFSVGGGFWIVPGLRQASNVTMHGVVATSLAVIALVSAASIASVVSQGLTISPLGWIFLAAVVFGMGVGRRLMTSVSAHRLFATVQALLAVALGAHTFLAR